MTVLTLLIPACSVRAVSACLYTVLIITLSWVPPPQWTSFPKLSGHTASRDVSHTACSYLQLFWHLLTHTNTHPEGMVPIWSTKWIKKENPVPWGAETACHTLYLFLKEKKHNSTYSLQLEDRIKPCFLYCHTSYIDYYILKSISLLYWVHYG